jgi:hypothetical protein
MRIKVSDGDLLLVEYGGQPTQEHVDALFDDIEMWLKERGLDNVSTTMMAHPEVTGIKISVLSVNDLFEEQVLKKE